MRPENRLKLPKSREGAEGCAGGARSRIGPCAANDRARSRGGVDFCGGFRNSGCSARTKFIFAIESLVVAAHGTRLNRKSNRCYRPTLCAIRCEHAVSTLEYPWSTHLAPCEHGSVPYCGYSPSELTAAPGAVPRVARRGRQRERHPRRLLHLVRRPLPAECPPIEYPVSTV